MRFIVIFLVIFASLAQTDALPTPRSANRSFTIDYENQTFLKDGKAFRYISGTLHYFQIPRELWRDRMMRVRALGCNALQTYVKWSQHEPYEGHYEFTKDANISNYLSLAQELGFVVILRIGPFINAEMDFGGFPYWLLKNKDIVLRSSQDQRYLDSVQKWLTYLYATVVKPYLYANGGPIIMVQIENEYGFHPACDQEYMIWMRDLARASLGNDTVLFTTDGPSVDILRCAQVPSGVLPTIDFGVGRQDEVVDRFSALRQFLPKGPMVNSEFYPGWLDKWSDKKHSTIPSLNVIQTMQYIWNLNVTSFNIYPAHGGTNWGYTAGSNSGPPFQGVTTGYDFDAPISESGDITPKFIDMRNQIEAMTGNVIPYPIPDSPEKYAYGRLRLEFMGTVLDLLNSLTPPNRTVNSIYPLTMEEIDQAYGFVVYETTIPKSSGRLEISGVRDRAYVMVDGQLTQVIQRQGPQSKLAVIQLSKFRQPNNDAPSKLHILVENQGRICFGPDISDPKGLVSNITLNDQVLTNWTMYPIDLDRVYQYFADANKLEKMRKNRKGSPFDRNNKYIPSIYYGYFFADPKAGDTFYDPSGWGKGQLYINGRNIGRYWPQAGPQISLYVPGVYLTQSDYFNQIYVLELDQAGGCGVDGTSGCWAQFTNHQIYT